MKAGDLAAYLEGHASDIGDEVARRMAEQHPTMFATYRRRARNKSKSPEEWCAEDSAHHLRALAAAVSIDDPSEFETYRAWLVEMLGARDIPEEDVELNFSCLAVLLGERLGDDAAGAIAMLRATPAPAG
jgi:NAD(P)-dependent dehydrogenase (short-subunit alcohol dehydrogenase family)